VEREGAQAAARNTVKRGAHAAAPAPQASLTVSRQPSLRVAVKCGVCIVALLGIVVLATTFVARLASIRILPATQFAEDLIRGSLAHLLVGGGLEIKKGLLIQQPFFNLYCVLAGQNVHRNFETETHIGKLGFAPGHGYLQLKKLLLTT
jgi:hypothetical protein